MCARSVRLRRGSALRCGPGVLISPGGEALSVLRSAAAPRWVGSARLGSALRSAPLSSDPNVCLCPAQILLNYLPLERALWSSLLKKQR